MQQLSAQLREKIGRNVWGHDERGAVYYHGGHYYSGDGEYLYSNPDVSPPRGAREVPNPNSGAEGGEGEDGGGAEDRESQLLKLTVTQLQKLQRAAGVKEEDVIKGEGARVKLVSWLLANTTE
jgi:hypothetical protein